MGLPFAACEMRFCGKSCGSRWRFFVDVRRSTG